MNKKGYVYFMTNTLHTVLYTGVTSDLKRRVTEHKEGRGSKFTKKYLCDILVYYEVHPSLEQAIERETQLKNYHRKWKNELIDKSNPEWQDLAPVIVQNPTL